MKPAPPVTKSLEFFSSKFKVQSSKLNVKVGLKKILEKIYFLPGIFWFFPDKQENNKMNGPIYQKSDEFAREIFKLYGKLVANHEFVISKQLLRCGTSVGANVNEASSAESKKDFISKNSIALKEAKESVYWLNLLDSSKLIEYDFQKLISLNTEIIKILSKIIITSKKKL
jgi:four helix bundle protein